MSQLFQAYLYLKQKHWKKTKLGWPHPSIYQMQPSEANSVLANRGNPLADLKSVRDHQFKFVEVSTEGNHFLGRHPSDVASGARHRGIIHWLENHRFNFESVIFQPMEMLNRLRSSDGNVKSRTSFAALDDFLETTRLPHYHQMQQPGVVTNAHHAHHEQEEHDEDEEEGAEEEQDDDDEQEAQYPNPMNNPFAEVEHGWRKSFTATDSDQQQQPLKPTTSTTTLQTRTSEPKVPLPLQQPSALDEPAQHVRRADQPGLFRPPNSSSASKNSFSNTELSLDHAAIPRTRLSSFPTNLEPISASPASPSFPYPASIDHHHQQQQQQQQQPLQPSYQLPASRPPCTSRASLPSSQWPPANLSSSCSSSFSSSDDGLLLRQASSSSLASAASVASSTNGLKARRGLTKPLSLSLAVPPADHHHSNAAQALATPLRDKHDPNSKTSAFSRSLPPSPRLGDLGQACAQFVGMKANVTGGLSMKRRTSISRLSLGGISSNDSSRGAYDPVQLIGRNSESVMNTPIQLHFDPVAAGEGRQELMSSQAGVGGKGHIEIPSEPTTESYPYEYQPKEVLPDVSLGSEQTARDGNLLSSMGFGLIINVAKEVDCPWEATSSPAPIEHSWPKLQPNKKGFVVRPTASTPNLKRSFEGKICVSLPEQPQPSHNPHNPNRTSSSPGLFQLKRLDADRKTSRPSLDYIKLPWSHNQDGLAEIFSSSEVFSLIDRARESKLKTLIHCQCGVSRSATFVIGYCMREAVYRPDKLPLSGRMYDAYSFVKEKSPWAGPNMGLIYQLIKYKQFLFKSRRQIVEEDEEEEEEEEGQEVASKGADQGEAEQDGPGGGDMNGEPANPSGDGGQRCHDDGADDDDEDDGDGMEGTGDDGIEAAADGPDSEMVDLDSAHLNHRTPTLVPADNPLLVVAPTTTTILLFDPSSSSTGPPHPALGVPAEPGGRGSRTPTM
ncbi:hypothetical protein PCASD_06397 [Puccinia coronata f. sp. avenae]|uniref:protein-tyrosine-phosphatase n=1 Tax=Puccinia coronata f. sp. avenae TaxID=200324 RepID=A0A2N5UXA1_9BASI|nr:hypothetical protein PCASD_06397 [Puccinia coronata f. sp. avenae]